jgi:hypothetical protein
MDVPVPVLVVVGLAFVTLVAIVIAPSRRVRSERRLPSEVETRVLMGERPGDIEAAIEPHEEPHVEPRASETMPPAS